MIDREAFVSRLIVEADTELERGAAYWLQVDGLELARLRAVVRDAKPWAAMIAAADRPNALDDDVLWDRVQPTAGEARAAAAWLRATQEAETPK